MTDRPPRDTGTAVLGAILVLLGLAFLGGQLIDDWLGASAWPLYVIAPGLALVAVGLVRQGGAGLVIAGTIVTVLGLLLLYQDATGNWESWAYAWALVGPAAPGLGMVLAGARSGERRMVRDGTAALLTGLALFAVGFVFFEGLLHISGQQLPLPEWTMPVLLIVLGLAALARAAIGGRREPDGT